MRPSLTLRSWACGTGRRTHSRFADYEKLVERVYFSVATEIYARLRTDVEHKIALLPTKYLRARAYLNEAEDYARSRTLDAYSDACELYLSLLQLYEPDWRTPVVGGWRRTWRARARWAAGLRHRWRTFAARAWERAARVELMLARAEIGYARTLLYREVLSGLSGQRVDSVFETRHLAQSAIRRLDNLPDDIEGWRAAFVDAHVTAAFAYSSLGSPISARESLERAWRFDPDAADRSAEYHFVASLIEPRLLVSLDLVRRAVDLDPELEVAQFSLAYDLEMLWRSRPELEPGVARGVIAEYERVLEINPGNIGASANIGYIEWLLENLDDAARSFERGREYKEIKHETVVSELDYGLARVAAEKGDFELAYDTYVSATAAAMSEVAALANLKDYFFAGIDLAIVARFERYEANVRARAEAEAKSPSVQGATRRARDSVLAFVLNDCASARIEHFNRTGEVISRECARTLLEEAAGLNARYPVTYYNMYSLGWSVPGIAAREELERAVSLAPNWPDPVLDLVTEYIDEMKVLRNQAARAAQDAAEKTREAERHRYDADAADKHARAAQEALETAKKAEPHRMRFEGEAARSGSAGADEVTHDPDEQPDEQEVVSLAERKLDGLGEQDDAVRAARKLERLRKHEEDARTALQAKTAQAEEAEKRAKDLREEADTSTRNAHACREKARKRVEDLLPHEWLWLGVRQSGGAANPTTSSVLDSTLAERGSVTEAAADLTDRKDVASTEGGRRQFNWDALFDEDVKRELRLERGLSALQARALCGMCAVALVEEDETSKDKVCAALTCIHERLWPDDEQVLDLLGSAEDEEGAPTQAQRYRDRLWLIRQWSLQGDPPFWRVRMADVPDEESGGDRRQAFVDSVKQLGDRPNVSPGVMVEAAEKLSQAGEHELAATMFERASVLDAERVGFDLQPDSWYVRRIALARWSAGDSAEAIRELESDTAQSGDAGWRQSVVESLLSAGGFVGSVVQFRLLQSWLGREVVRGPADSAAAFAFLFRWGYASLVLGRDDLSDVSPPRPVVLELDGPLFEREHAKWTQLPAELEETHLPEELNALREEIRGLTGVSVPPFSIRPAVWLLHPVGDGFRLYVRDKLIMESRIGEDSEDSPRDRSEETICHALKLPLLGHLAEFVDPDAVAEMLTSSRGGGWDAEDVDLLRLTRVVRCLVEERVPVHDLDAVLSEFDAVAPDASADVIAERVRHGLRRNLTELVLRSGAVELPEPAAAILREATGGTDRLTPFDAMLVRAALREQLARHAAARGDGARGTEPEHPALFVDEPGLRAAVVAISGREFPGLRIVERQDLVGATRPVGAET